MNQLEEFLEIEKDLQRKQRDYDKAKGALEQELTRMKKLYDINSIEEGKELLKKRRKKAEKLKNEFDEQFLAFKGNLDAKSQN